MVWAVFKLRIHKASYLSRDEKLESFNIEIRNMLWNNICDGVWISKVNKKPKCINSVIVQGRKGVQL